MRQPLSMRPPPQWGDDPYAPTLRRADSGPAVFYPGLTTGATSRWTVAPIALLLSLSLHPGASRWATCWSPCATSDPLRHLVAKARQDMSCPLRVVAATSRYAVTRMFLT